MSAARDTPSVPMIESGHPEATCERCGGRNLVWFAPSEAWNEVTVGVGREVVWCPECFTELAEHHGWHVTGFRAEVVRRPSAALRELTRMSQELPGGYR